MSRTTLSRRAVLGSAAALPLAGLATTSARAAAPMMGAATTRFNRVTIGDFEVTTLLAATTPRPDPHSIFGLNVDKATFDEASAAANIPTDQAQFFFTPTVINTGSDLVLFDTGLNPEGITSALNAAGYTPDQVDVVVITHMHGDHIGGLMGEGGATFPNARYVTASAEFDAWAAMDNGTFHAKMRPLAEQTEMIGDGASVASGITAMAAHGHTPGHTAYMIESGGSQLLIAADFANHYVWSLGYPDWEVKFDMDKTKAAETRRRLLGMLATDKIPFVGYHMPWPGTGYVSAKGDGFVYEPTSYQLML
ncbi:Glyoxylase, beta-lactamase superfamily II [Roseovarius tolerans]|uniref:Glyoxylase, beta-lactamase superfamily II n=1 Tax=Roseovarius tolerans TaxID=74031 RepID=A0A1H7Z6M0_9RHOB|nr:MBL fold metallo-hydrolase [Roseovarius tolerans]SEM53208.1 Glyoxylase, beta-lactamase superfamily II [Roseovarius tolerans]